MKLGIYIRVSSEEQVKSSNSIVSQKNKGVELCDFLESEYIIYEEPGLSGTLPISKLPSLINLLNDIENKEIDGISITKFDRLSRNESNWPIIKKTLKKNKAKLYIDGAEIDYLNYDVELIMNIKQSLAVHEVERLKHRVKQGLETGIKLGKVGGGKIQPYGYTKGENKELIIDKEEAKIVLEIYELALKGKGSKAIATILNDRGIPTKFQKLQLTQKYKDRERKEFIWKDGTVYGVLTNPIFKGQRRFRDKLYPAPRIVSDVMFDTVQKGLKKRNNFKNTTNKYFYLLKGLMICKNCGTYMSGYIKPNRGMRVYRCNSKRGHISHNCGSRGFNIDKLNDHVLNQLLNLPKIVEKSYDFYLNTQHDSYSIEKLNKIPVEIEKIKEKITETFDMDIPKEYKSQQINKHHQNIKDLEEEEKRLGVLLNYYTNKDQFISEITDMIKPLNKKKITNEEKQHIVRSLIDKIEVDYYDDDDNHLVFIHFNINPSSNLKLATLFKIDSLKYTKLDAHVEIMHLNDDTVANFNLDIEDNEIKRWIY